MEYCLIVKVCLLAIFITGVIGQCENREPNCYSRFDYEYKVLQRLIQIEEFQNGVTEKLASSENERVELNREIKRLEEKLAVYEQEKGELKRELAEKLAATEQEKDELRDELIRIRDVVNKLGDTGASEQGN